MGRSYRMPQQTMHYLSPCQLNNPSPVLQISHNALSAMAYKSKKECAAELAQLGEEAPESWTRPEILARIAEIQEDHGYVKVNKGKKNAPFRAMMIEMNRASKKKAQLQEYATTSLSMHIRGTEAIAQLQAACIRRIYETTPASPEDPVGFGQHCALSYSEVLTSQPRYCTWVMTTHQETDDTDYRLNRLATWLESLENPPKVQTPAKKKTIPASSGSNTNTKSKQELEEMVKSLQAEVKDLQSKDASLPRKMADKRDEDMSSSFSLASP